MAQADLSNRSRLTEQKEHAGPRCPHCSVVRIKPTQVGVLGLKDRGGESLTLKSKDSADVALLGPDKGSRRVSAVYFFPLVGLEDREGRGASRSDGQHTGGKLGLNANPLEKPNFNLSIRHHLWIVLLGITVESDNALRLYKVSAVLDAV